MRTQRVSLKGCIATRAHCYLYDSTQGVINGTMQTAKAGDIIKSESGLDIQMILYL
jgi:hypothetical protein